MKNMIRTSSKFSPLVWVALCTILFAFSGRPGAHSFKVYLDNKLVLDQYASFKTDAPKLPIDLSANYSELVVKYSECGRTVTGRKLTLKDEQNKLLKEWSFEGSASGFNESMICKVKDIASFKKGNSTLKLFYSSKEFPEGQQVAYVLLNGEAKTALNN